ncbi:MAG TPA: IS982 family transposase, partial [Amycolatopsis sp.]|nr:IS982 family transposase [Amycolatopsis sp.]
GVLVRVAQRLLAMAAGIWHNWNTDVTSKRSLIALDH